MSRYYDPVTHRFVNSDGYFQAGNGLLDTNMNAYCANNPVNFSDPTGEFAIPLFFLATVITVTVALVVTYAVTKTFSNPSVRQGISDTASSIGNTISNAISNARSNTNTYDNAKDDTRRKSSQSTKIYRYGGTNPGNFVPTAQDVATNTGLSFSTIPKRGCAVTTIEELNATGVVCAYKDSATHVTVKPIGGTVADWRDAGSSSVWTQAVKSVVKKWDGGN